MTGNEDLRASVRELQDLEAIRRFKARYCRLVDDGGWDELAQMFTPDAVCDYGFFGRYEGRDRIIDGFFRGLVGPATSFNAHMVHNPEIDVHGDTATARWYLTAQTTIQPANQAVWVMGVYHDEFRRVGGEWQLSLLRFEFRYYTRFEDGWAKLRMWNPAS